MTERRSKRKASMLASIPIRRSKRRAAVEENDDKNYGSDFGILPSD